VFRNGVKATAALAVTIGALALPAASNAAECEVDACFAIITPATGIAKLNFSSSAILLAEQKVGEKLIDCTWPVDVVYDNGDPTEHYTFVASNGLSASHTFTEYGEYEVNILAQNGIHSEGGEPCRSFHFLVTVLFKEPKEEPPVEEPPVEEPPSGENGGKRPPTSEEESGAPTPQGEAIVLWRQCKGGVSTKGVTCRKGRKVVRGALAALGREKGSTKISGFTCKFRPSQLRPLTCRRGSSQIIGPYG